MQRHASTKPPPLPSWYSFGRSWAHDQNEALLKRHWQILPHLVLWALIAAVMVPVLLR